MQPEIKRRTSRDQQAIETVLNRNNKMLRTGFLFIPLLCWIPYFLLENAVSIKSMVIFTLIMELVHWVIFQFVAKPAFNRPLLSDEKEIWIGNFKSHDYMRKRLTLEIDGKRYLFMTNLHAPDIDPKAEIIGLKKEDKVLIEKSVGTNSFIFDFRRVV